MSRFVETRIILAGRREMPAGSGIRRPAPSRRIAEAGVQLPLMRDLNGTALERGHIVRAGLRYNF